MIFLVYYCISISGSASSQELSQPPSPSPNGQPDNKDISIELFGTIKSQPISRGMVIFNNKCIPTPYVIERKGFSIYINNVCVEKNVWYAEEQVEDPGDPPEAYNPVSAVDNPEHRKYSVKKLKYLNKKHPPEEAKKRMVDVFRKSRWVHKIECVDEQGQLIELKDQIVPDEIYVTDTKGDSKYIRIGNSMSPPHLQKKLAADYANSKYDRFISTLNRNALLYFDKRQDEIILEDRIALGVLDILRSSISSNEKFKSIKSLDVFYNDDHAKEIISDLKIDESLLLEIANMRITLFESNRDHK
jgi:hypothetical protein